MHVSGDSTGKVELKLASHLGQKLNVEAETNVFLQAEVTRLGHIFEEERTKIVTLEE